MTANDMRARLTSTWYAVALTVIYNIESNVNNTIINKISIFRD